MKSIFYSAFIIFTSSFLFNCGGSEPKTDETKDSVVTNDITTFEIEMFADVQVLSYEIPGFDSLTLKQKTLVYYLYEAGLCGRDMAWDQNYRHNLEIRNALEEIVKVYNGDKESEDWKKFMTYTKRVWFSNGIHHHYSMDKFLPEFSRTYFEELLMVTATELDSNIITIMFDPTLDNKRVSLDVSKDLIQSSACNFYGENITQKDVDAFYKEKMAAAGDKPVEFGLNSKLVKDEDGTVREEVYKVGGMYNDALVEMIYWLEKAKTVAENAKQGIAIGLLIEYYQTGDLNKWAEFNIAWSQATEGDIDIIQGFVEVYGDPVGMRGGYESIVQVTDF